MSHAIQQTIPLPEMNDDVGSATRAAANGPVVITDDGKPAFVLMTHEEYLSREKKGRSILHAFEDPSPEADFDFDPPRDRTPYAGRDVDFG